MKNDEINLEGMFCILAKKKKRKKKKINAMGPFFDVIYLFLFLFFKNTKDNMLYLSLGEGDPVGEELIFKVNAPFRLRNHM